MVEQLVANVMLYSAQNILSIANEPTFPGQLLSLISYNWKTWVMAVDSGAIE